MAVVGRGQSDGSRQEALAAARRDAIRRLLERTGMKAAVSTHSVTRDRGVASGQPTATTRTRERLRLSSRAFLGGVRRRDQWTDRTAAGRYIARVLLHLPGREAGRIRAARARHRQARWKPAMRRYREVVARYRDLRAAARARRIGRALRMIPGVMDAYRRATTHPGWAAARPRIVARGDWPYPLTRKELVRQATRDITIRAAGEGARYEIGNGPLRIRLEATRDGRPVRGLTLRGRVPSGRVARATTGDCGRALLELPPPAHPGHYRVHVAPILRDGESLAAAAEVVRVRVVGEAGLARGTFHAFREARGVGRVPAARARSRPSARQRALAAARINALGRLVEQDGTVERQLVTRSARLREGRTAVASRGRLAGLQVRQRSVRWQGGAVVGRVVVRLPLTGGKQSAPGPEN